MGQFDHPNVIALKGVVTQSRSAVIFKATIMILRGTEQLGQSQEIFISFFLCNVLRGMPLRAPPVLYFSQKVLLLQFKTESTRTLSNFDFQWTIL